MRRNLAKWLPHRFCKESAVLALFTTCDLAIGDLAIGDIAFGDLAIGCHDVRVATNFVKMMKRKKVARNKSSKLDSSILILLAILHRVSLPCTLFLRKIGILSSLFLSQTRTCAAGLKSFLAFTGPA